MTTTDHTTNAEYLARLARILETPADDAPRLILSDWLEENGEEERAKEIRHFVANPNFYRHVSTGNVFTTDCRGFISEVRLTCAELMGGTCERCEGGHSPSIMYCDRCDFRNTSRNSYGRNISCNICGAGRLIIPRPKKCSTCAGTGSVEGVARALFERHPLVRIVLTCRKPLPTAGGYCWFDASASRNYPESSIPDELFKIIARADFMAPTYETEAAALAALSDAAVAYGRSLVGLPALEDVTFQ